MKTLRLAPFLLAAAAAALAAPLPARACSVCACGDPLLTASDPAAMTGQLRLQLDTEYLRVDAGSETVDGGTDQLTQWSYRLNLAYRPLEALTLTATLPVVSKAMSAVGAGVSAQTSDTTGLGDVEVGARYAFWRAVDLGRGRVQELAVTAGTSTPTGPNSLRADGERIDEHGQPGTGSWGPFAGLAYRYEQREWLAFASVAGRVHSENGYGYRYGSSVQWSVHGQWFAAKRVALDLGVDGRHAAADAAPEGAVDHTGGTLLALAPGVYVNPAGRAWLFVRGQVPFYKDLRGEQDQLPSVVTGLQYQLR